MVLLKTQIEGGYVEGLPAGNQAVSVFKGIPYAAPPVGDLRWKAPQPVQKWQGVKQCYAFSDIPMQARVAKDSFYQKEFYPIELPMNEDCLYLNIWTPAQSAYEKLPVAMWIYGGGLFQGYGHKMEFDGEAFAKRGVILVTFNYRLNVFGFLAHPELTMEDANHTSGNYGSLDQIYALKWIRRNIAAFGGDPDNITIFGQSSGGGSVQTLLTSPLTKGDIHKAIMQSAGGLGKRVAGAQKTLAQYEQTGIAFLKYAGLKDIAQAREMPAQELNAIYLKYIAELKRPGVFGTSVDGYLLKDFSDNVLLSDDYPRIPYMLGCMKDESPGMSSAPVPLEKYQQEIREEFGERAEEFFEAANVKNDADAGMFYHDCYPNGKLAAHLAWCELQLEQGRQPSYMYYFTHVPPGEPSVGVFHSAEHMYVFQTFLRGWRPYTGEDFELSNKVCDYWTNFIKTGDPNGADLPNWTPYTKQAPLAMEMKPNGGMMRIKPLKVVEMFRDAALKRL